MDKHEEQKEKIITDRFVSGPEDHLTPEEVSRLTPDIVIERIKALKPWIAKEAYATEQRGRPSDELWRAIRRTGYLYLAQHKRYGGLQAPIDKIVDATLHICQADAATGWLASFSVTTGRSIAGYPMHAQKKVYEGGKCFTILRVALPIGKAVKVPGGYTISGRWAWATTCQIADWVSFVCEVDTPDGVKEWSFLTPAKNMTILDTWRAHGMVATGTHHVTVKDLFVPDDMVCDTNVSEALWVKRVHEFYGDYPVYLGPPGAALALHNAMAVVGGATNCVEAAKQFLTRHVKRNGVAEKDNMTAQMRLGHASALATAADRLLRHAANEIYTMVGHADAESEDLYHMARAWIAESIELSRQVAQVVMQAASTSAHYQDSPLGRAFRDVYTGGSHVISDFDSCMVDLGRKMLGLETERRKTLRERKNDRDEFKATINAHDYARN